MTFTLSGTQTTTTTDANGIAKIKMTQNSGTYNIQFRASGCSNLIDVEVFEGNCHFKYQLNKLYQTEAFKVILLDANNNPLANKQITITVNGVSYYRTTDVNGLSALNISLNTGNYVISYAFAGDNTYSQCSGSTLLQVIRKDVVLTPLTSSVVTHSQQYLVKLTDTSYKPIVNECVVITVNGVPYNRNTDSNGVAKLNINLNPGYFYSITATYNPQSPTPYNSKTITTSLGVYEAYQESSINFTGTYFTRNSYLTVTLKTPYGSIISGRMVNLWINDNMYSYVTNNQGQVSFQLNLPTGIYGVTAMYGSVGHYSSYVYRLIYVTDGKMNNNYSTTWVDSSNEYQCSNDTLITNLANELTANCNSDLEKAAAIHAYISRMKYRLYGDGLNDAHTSLLLFTGNCVDQSNVFLAIAKKAGLIVRGVTGVSSDLTAGHAWTQVKIDDKWVVAEITGYSFGCWPGNETYSNNRNYFPAFNKDGY